MATSQKIPAVEQIGVHLECLEMFFDVNVVKDKKMAMFGTLLGARNCTLIYSLVAPTNPKKFMYQELVELCSHFKPKPWGFFFPRVCGQLHAALRQLATKCELGNFLDEVI